MVLPGCDPWHAPVMTSAPQSGHQALLAHAPEVADLLASLEATLPGGERSLVAQARWLTARQNRLAPLAGATPPPSEDEQTGAERIATEVAEQLALDVSSMTQQQRDELEAELGRGAHTHLLSVYLADWLPRVHHALDALHGDGPRPEVVVHADDSRLWSDFVTMTEAVSRLRVLDPVTGELVRLRMARAHNCDLCKSLRNRTALEAGGDESDYADLDRWQTSDRFDERTRAALALADALVWTPADLDLDVVRAVRTHFTPAEQTELVLDMLRNAANKVAVASGTDGANVSEGVEIYDVVESGETVFGLGHLV